MPHPKTLPDYAAADSERDAQLEPLRQRAEKSGDYSDVDDLAADLNQDRADDLAALLHLAGRTGNLLADVFGDVELGDEVGQKLNCGEAEYVALALHLLGKADAAATFLAGHAEGDNRGDSHQHLADADTDTVTRYVVELAIGNVTIPDPDDPHDMPIYHGPLVAAHEQLAAGEYRAVTEDSAVITVTIGP